MKTILLKIDKDNIDMQKIEIAASIIKGGGTVVFPTETVYGLGADAFSKDAVAKIFFAKGRPADNPLIVHISDIAEITMLTEHIPQIAKKLFKAFSPGPFTLILKKKSSVPDITTGGLNTVAVRIPDNYIARALISACGMPIAAPSANKSGSPSPTNAQHCIKDLFGRVDCIIDGGDCSVGLESTVVKIDCDNVPVILRPGGITTDMILEVAGDVRIDRSVLNSLSKHEHPISPGTKYTHYAPKCPLYIVRGNEIETNLFLAQWKDNPKIGLLVFEEDNLANGINILSLGFKDDFATQATRLYHCIRTLDSQNVEKIYTCCPDITGVGLAVYNRLVRAAGFKFIDISEQRNEQL